MNELDIFAAVLELDGPEREKYLDEACGENPELRKRIQVLLRSSEKAASFMESPPSGVEPTMEMPQISERTGTIIGNYKLMEQIGEGGMGVVYVAEQERPMRRRVALKVIKPGMDTKEVISRFAAERQALALMDHPNIAKVHDAGTTDSGRPYFVMELVRGIPITEYCDLNRFNARERLELFIHVCQAVQHAHQKGIIHRDLKPPNVLITEHDGTPVVKVIDFGVAKAINQQLTERTIYTRHQQMVGTPMYMSPEQAELSGLDVDTRSDIYSLGVLLYELLTGTTPFDKARLSEAAYDEIRKIIREEEPSKPSTKIRTLGKTATSISGYRHTDPKNLSQLLRGDLDWIVMKTLEKDRNRRYDTAKGLANDIERHLNDEPVVARPPSATYQLHKFTRRNRATVLMSSTIAASLMLGTVGATIGWLRAIDARNKTESAKGELATQVLETRAALNTAVSAENTAVQTAYLADMQAAHQALASHNLGLARQILKRNRHFDANNDPRNWEWRALWLQCQGDAENDFRIGPGSIGSISVSHDGEWAAAVVGGNIQVWNTLSDNPSKTSKTLNKTSVNWPPSFAVAFSPTDNRLYGTVEEGVIRSWEIPTFVESKETLRVDGRLRNICISPDGKKLAALGYDGMVTVWELPIREQKERFLGGHLGYDGGSLAISPDSSKLALGLLRKIRIIDLDTYKELYVIDAGGRDCVEFSPDGKWIATNGWQLDKLIHVRNVEDGKEVAQLRGHTLDVNDFAFSRDGKRLASASADQTVRLWDTETWQEAAVLSGHGTTVSALAFASNGKQVLSGDIHGYIRVWNSDVAADATWPISDDVVREGQVRPHLDATFSPDSKLLATVNRDQGVTLRSAETLEVMRTITDPGGKSRGVRFSPTENLLAVGYMNGSLALIDLDKSSEVEPVVVQAGADIFPVRFSRGGERLLVVAHGDNETICAIYSIDRRRVITTWTVPSYVHAAVLSPDGKTVVTRHNFLGATYLWSVKDIGNPTIFPGHDDVDFSRDGQHLVMDAGNRHELAIVDVTTAKTVGRLVGHRHNIGSIQFSPDGKRVATGANDSVKIWDFATRRELLTLETYGWYNRQVEWSPDGNSILLISGGGKLSLWRVPTMEQILAAD